MDIHINVISNGSSTVTVSNVQLENMGTWSRDHDAYQRTGFREYTTPGQEFSDVLTGTTYIDSSMNIEEVNLSINASGTFFSINEGVGRNSTSKGDISVISFLSRRSKSQLIQDIKSAYSLEVQSDYSFDFVLRGGYSGYLTTAHVFGAGVTGDVVFRYNHENKTTTLIDILNIEGGTVYPVSNSSTVSFYMRPFLNYINSWTSLNKFKVYPYGTF